RGRAMLTKAGERLAATGPAQCPTPRSALLMTAPHRGRCRDETARIRESVRRSGAGGGVSRRNRLPGSPSVCSARLRGTVPGSGDGEYREERLRLNLANG